MKTIIKISKNQWEEIGEKTGWIKKADSLDVYKSVRKPMPPPGKIMDTKTPPRQKNINFSESDDIRVEAEYLCTRFGHELDKWIGNYNTCLKCHKTVEVDPVNDEIIGPATKEECI